MQEQREQLISAFEDQDALLAETHVFDEATQAERLVVVLGRPRRPDAKDEGLHAPIVQSFFKVGLRWNSRLPAAPSYSGTGSIPSSSIRAT